jgi:hypothetical protein
VVISWLRRQPSAPRRRPTTPLAPRAHRHHLPPRRMHLRRLRPLRLRRLLLARAPRLRRGGVSGVCYKTPPLPSSNTRCGPDMFHRPTLAPTTTRDTPPPRQPWPVPRLRPCAFLPLTILCLVPHVPCATCAWCLAARGERCHLLSSRGGRVA